MVQNMNSFRYNDTEIEFELTSNSVMVNATEMAKAFGKLPKDFLVNQQTIDFVNECCKDENYFKIVGFKQPENPAEKHSGRGNSHFQNEENAISGKGNSPFQNEEKETSQEGNSPLGNEESSRKDTFVKVNYGGHHRGTWFHRLLAVKFAAWLNPAFDLWVTMTIDEILFGHYKDFEGSLKESAKRKAEKDELVKKLENSETYRRIMELDRLERQDQLHRAKLNRNQLDLFTQNYRTPANN